MKTLKFFFVTALLAGLAFFSANGASASLSQCTGTNMCAWGNNDFNWLIANQAHGQSNWIDPFNDANGENNQTDSWANRSATYTGCLADSANGDGDRVTMAKASNDNNLAFFNSDEASGMRTKNGC